MGKNHRNPPSNRIVEQRTQIQNFGGPLPPADHFSAYDTVLPGAGERILRMAEKEQTARIEQQAKFQELQKHAVEEELRLRKRGQGIGAWITSGVCLGGLVVIGLGHATAGAVSIIGALSSVVIALLTGRPKTEEPREEK